jgi:hypothetical protein
LPHKLKLKKCRQKRYGLNAADQTEMKIVKTEYLHATRMLAAIFFLLCLR